MKIIFRALVAIVLFSIIGIGLLFALHINSAPTLDEAVKAQWSQVQNQYKRRADLVPTLVATVKGSAAHENETLNQVTQARAQVGKMKVDESILNDPEAMKKYLAVQQQLSSSLGRLMAVAESYPDLKANKNFLTLQSQLEGTENRIAVARRDYIAATRAYNTELRTFPGVIIARILYPDAKVRETFSVSEQEQQAPKVEF